MGSVMNDILMHDPPHMKIVGGDIFEATDDSFLVHQCNCVTVNARGFAEEVFRRFPQADTYCMRSESKHYHTPGTIDVIGNVINLYAQLLPGGPIDDHYPSKKYMTQKYSKSVDTSIDTRQMRLEWFSTCLTQVGIYFLQSPPHHPTR